MSTLELIAEQSVPLIQLYSVVVVHMRRTLALARNPPAQTPLVLMPFLCNRPRVGVFVELQNN